MCESYEVPGLNSYNAEILLYKPWKPKFFQFIVIINMINILKLFPLHLNTYVYGYSKYILLLQLGDRFYTSEADDYRCQILTSKVDPRAVGVKIVCPCSLSIYVIFLSLCEITEACTVATGIPLW